MTLEQIPPGDIWTEYKRIGFDCITPECVGTIYVTPDGVTCHLCGQEYDVDVSVTVS